MELKHNKSYLGSNIKFLRRLNGLTQTELGKKLGISRGNVSTFESGVVQPNSQIFGKLTELFDVHPVQLVEQNLTKKMPQNLQVDEKNLGIKGKFVFDHVKTFIQETNQLTKILEGYQVFDEIREQNRAKDSTGLVSIYQDLLSLLEMGLRNNWALISSVGLEEEE